MNDNKKSNIVTSVKTYTIIARKFTITQYLHMFETI